MGVKGLRLSQHQLLQDQEEGLPADVLPHEEVKVHKQVILEETIRPDRRAGLRALPQLVLTILSEVLQGRG